MHGHLDRPRSVLSRHIAQMYVNWPMAGYNFVHWSINFANYFCFPSIWFIGTFLLALNQMMCHQHGCIPSKVGRSNQHFCGQHITFKNDHYVFSKSIPGQKAIVLIIFKIEVETTACNCYCNCWYNQIIHWSITKAHIKVAQMAGSQKCMPYSI